MRLLIGIFCLAWPAVGAASPGSAVILARLGVLRDVIGNPALAVDGKGNLYVAGTSNAGALSPTEGALNGGEGQPCGFVVKLAPDASSIRYAATFGCNGTQVKALAVDGSGNAYVTGMTVAPQFPAANSLRNGWSGNARAFVAKLNADGSQLVYASRLGESLSDVGTAIAVDGEGSAYVAGSTDSLRFPVVEAAQPQPGGPPCSGFFCRQPTDAFVVRINPAGDALVFSTYLGGSQDDAASGIAVDGAGSVYVTGYTNSSNFPTTPGAWQASCTVPFPTGGGCADQTFAAKLGASGRPVHYATVAGNPYATHRGEAIAVDSSGNAYIATAGSGVIKLNPAGSAPVWGISLGDAARSVAVDRQGNAYAAYCAGQSIFVAALNPERPVQAYFSPGCYGSVAVDGEGRVIVAAAHYSDPIDPVPGGVTIGCGDDYCGMALLGAVDLSIPELRFTPVLRPEGVLNAASLRPGAIAPGEFVTIRGEYFGPDEPVEGQANSRGVLPRWLAHTRVYFNRAGASVVLFAGPGQVVALAPYGIGRDSAQVTVSVEYRGIESNRLVLPLVPASPAIFTQTGHGDGPGVIFNEDASLNYPDRPAAAGSLVRIQGTGGGETDPPGLDGLLCRDPAPRPRLPVTVTIGGIAAEVVSASCVPGRPAGLLEVAVRIPAAVPAGIAPVELTIGEQHSPAPVTVFIAP